MVTQLAIHIPIKTLHDTVLKRYPTTGATSTMGKKQYINGPSKEVRHLCSPTFAATKYIPVHIAQSAVDVNSERLWSADGGFSEGLDGMTPPALTDIFKSRCESEEVGYEYISSPRIILCIDTISINAEFFLAQIVNNSNKYEVGMS